MKISITIPVFNGETHLVQSITHLRRYLASEFRWPYEIVIADNASTDGSLRIAQSLAKQYPDLRVHHLDLKGRGRALKHVWLGSGADILSYMDVDLSTDLSAFSPLIEALASGRFDLATGSRLQPESLTQRSWKRERISRCYNRLVRLIIATGVSDLQCGFKAITKELALTLLPAVEDPGWFFDTELLLIAEKCGYRILDLPVQWSENADTRVQLLATAWADIRGLLRLRRNFSRGRYAQLLKPVVRLADA